MSTAPNLIPEEIKHLHVENDKYIEIRYYPIMKGVQILTYSDKGAPPDQASFEIGDASIELEYNEEIRDLIENIDTFEAVELLALIEANLEEQI
ncbi:hypothetical protein [Alteribacillus sp. YIM 98480]|uniref:hypothetical protein n=1 Tax=Alteribacillus sp. YIM 98480 TaxID=2606599 RepID=UPI00131BDECA|nr:hypothetical protein [Alteribacillus sp. YIM 98480]